MSPWLTRGTLPPRNSELAYQICDQFAAFGAGMTLHALVVVGGEDMRKQATALSRRPHVIVATPGRLVDHIRSDPTVRAALSRVRFLVLDEADRLLEPAVEPELEAISEALPKKRRQTLLFSATITRGIAALQARSPPSPPRLPARPSPRALVAGRRLSRDTSAPPCCVAHPQEVTLAKAFHFEAYEGLRTADNLRQEYLLVPAKVWVALSDFCALFSCDARSALPPADRVRREGVRSAACCFGSLSRQLASSAPTRFLLPFAIAGMCR